MTPVLWGDDHEDWEEACSRHDRNYFGEPVSEHSKATVLLLLIIVVITIIGAWSLAQLD